MVAFFGGTLYIINTKQLVALGWVIADAASEPEASEQVSSSNSYWALKVRFYFRFSDQNAFC